MADNLTLEQRHALARIQVRLKVTTALASAIVGVIIYDLYHNTDTIRDPEREAYLRG